jgi:RND family efflux transporter MFP subunit
VEPKLKPTMVVETGTSGNRLIDQSTGRAATISRTEALILSLTDGRHTPAQIAMEATRLGTPLMVGDVQRALQRFEKAGILKPKEELAVVIDLHASDAVADDPPTVVRAPPQEELDPNRPLPPFRQDLQVRRSAQKAVFDTLDPQSGKSFPLYDFEVSLARMMDGRRTAAQVLETGSGLGISVTLESLGKFVRQLQAYGFLGEPLEPEAAAAPPPSGGPAWGQTWERRDAWEDAVRTLFRTGLRMLRLSKPAEAKQYFSAVLESAPDNQEAREMLAVAEAALGSQKIRPVEAGPGPLPPLAAVVTEPALAATAPDAPALGSDPVLDEKLRALESLSGPHEMPTAAQLSAGSPRRGGSGWLPWTIALLAVAGAIGYGAWIRRGGSAPDAPKIPLVVARMTGPSGRSLMAAGYVSAAHLISIGAPAGRVKTVAVTVGQKVQPGTVLVALDDSEQQAQAKLARARVRDANRSLASTKRLYHAQAATAVELERARGQAEIAWAELSVIQEHVKQAIVSSPSAGTVLEVPVHAGELVPANDPSHPVVKLADLSDLVAEVAVNEADVKQVRLGQQADVSSDAVPGQNFAGQVTEISEQADRARGTVNVKVAVRQPGDVLRPGMSVKATFKDDAAAPQRLLLPRSALDGDSLWVVDRDGRAVRRPVKSSPSGPSMVEIQSGLTEGEQVVADPATVHLAPGQRVTP